MSGHGLRSTRAVLVSATVLAAAAAALALSPDSFDPGDDTGTGATLLGTPAATEATHGPHTLTDTDTADWFAFDLEAGVTYTFFSTGSDDTVATLYGDSADSDEIAISDDDALGL